MPVIKKRSKQSRKYSATEIKGLTHELSEFLAPYKKRIITVALFLAAVTVISGGYLFLQYSWDKQASPLLNEAYEYYSPASGVPADYAKALERYRTIQKDYSSTTSGAIAQYYVANSLSNLEDHENAVKEYQYFTKKYSSKKFLLGMVWQRLGYAYLALGKQEEAVKAFQQAEAVQGPGLATVELAKMFERMGKKEEAQKKYTIIAEKLAGTPWAYEAMSKIPKKQATVTDAAPSPSVSKIEVKKRTEKNKQKKP